MGDFICRGTQKENVSKLHGEMLKVKAETRCRWKIVLNYTILVSAVKWLFKSCFQLVLVKNGIKE